MCLAMVACATYAVEHWRMGFDALAGVFRGEAMRLAHAISLADRSARTVICEPF